MKKQLCPYCGIEVYYWDYGFYCTNCGLFPEEPVDQSFFEEHDTNKKKPSYVD